MITKKILLFLIATFTLCAVYAQKPLTVLVWGAPCAQDSANRVSSLVLEYFKSELATHSGLKLVNPDELAEALKKYSPGKTNSPAKARIQQICKLTKSNVFCAVALTIMKQKFYIEIKLFDANGKLLNTVKKTFETIKESDLVSVQIARDTAVAIRGISPVDVIHNEREKRLQQELLEAEKAEKEKKK
ncbi:MAG: hypothetical protein IKB16_10480 [Lentisphaeria bacterium]|nr:hypothetical protein [Lentisphaeria bacterium]